MTSLIDSYRVAAAKVLKAEIDMIPEAELPDSVKKQIIQFTGLANFLSNQDASWVMV